MKLSEITPEMAAGAGVSIPLFWLFISKIVVKIFADKKEIKESEVGIKAAEARMDVIYMLKTEVERMLVANSKLSDSMAVLTEENMNLRLEVFNLKQSVNDMSHQLHEISRREELQPYDGTERRKAE